MEFLKKLFSWFFKEKVVYTYDMLYANNDNFTIVLPNIVSYNKVISNILKDNDLLNDREYKHIPKMNRTTMKSTMLSGWCMNGLVNDSVSKEQLLKDINKEIKLFLKLSGNLIDQFNKLKEVKKYDNNFKYNIRILEPFILNLGYIRYMFIIKNK